MQSDEQREKSMTKIKKAWKVGDALLSTPNTEMGLPGEERKEVKNTKSNNGWKLPKFDSKNRENIKLYIQKLNKCEIG